MEELLNLYSEIEKITVSEVKEKNGIKEVILTTQKRKAFTLYIPQNSNSVIIILPGVGFKEKSERLILKNFNYILKNNIGICIFNLNNGFFLKGDTAFFNFFREKISEIRGVVEYIKEKMKIENINLLGISFGGVIGFIASAIEDEIKKSIFIVSGVDIELLIWRSLLRFKIKKDCSRKVCNRMHIIYKKLIKNNLYNEILNLPRKCFLYDPLTYLKKLENKKVLMINGLFDV
ncbi:MAG: alpha/beta hydrolase, partial [bacterium]|nr:alpha/beta hydrolase [bacterium]MDW8163504.1 hypothetical protein [Candidatus Omnitrophota bacterium]